MNLRRPFRSNDAFRAFFIARRLLLRAEARLVTLSDEAALDAAYRSFRNDPLANRDIYVSAYSATEVGRRRGQIQEITWHRATLARLDPARLP